MGVAGKRLGNVEAAHAAEFLLFLEEEELVGLHLELAADGVVVVEHQVVDARLVELFADGQAGRSGADDCHGGTVDLFLVLQDGGGAVDHREALLSDAPDFPHAVDLGDADAADVAVDEHLAGAAFADAALHGALAVFQAVVVDREAGLVQGGCDGLAFLAADLLSFKYEFVEIFLGDIQDGMG